MNDDINTPSDLVTPTVVSDDTNVVAPNTASDTSIVSDVVSQPIIDPAFQSTPTTVVPAMPESLSPAVDSQTPLDDLSTPATTVDSSLASSTTAPNPSMATDMSSDPDLVPPAGVTPVTQTPSVTPVPVTQTEPLATGTPSTASDNNPPEVSGTVVEPGDMMPMGATLSETNTSSDN